jgi:hypothetical protein
LDLRQWISAAEGQQVNPRNKIAEKLSMSNISKQHDGDLDIQTNEIWNVALGCEWSTRVLAPPIAHGTDDRAEVTTLCGEDVLDPRGTHRMEAPLDDAILLKRPQALR